MFGVYGGFCRRSKNRTVLFSTHVVEDLAATCNQLAIMHKGRFLYAGSIRNLVEEAQGKIWICKAAEKENRLFQH